MTKCYKKNHRGVVVGDTRIHKLYCFLVENGCYPDEEEITESIRASTRRVLRAVYEGRREPRYESTAWVITPAPVFRTPDDFEFPPDSPERKRLEEVRRGIKEKWELTERRALTRGYWNVYSHKDNSDLFDRETDFSLLSDEVPNKLVDDIEETKFKERKKRWSARSRKDKERIVCEFFRNEKTGKPNQ